MRLTGEPLEYLYLSGSIATLGADDGHLFLVPRGNAPAFGSGFCLGCIDQAKQQGLCLILVASAPQRLHILHPLGVVAPIDSSHQFVHSSMSLCR